MTSQQIFTVGYRGHTQMSFLDCLKAHEITLLCDVRRNPISRKKGFSKNTLALGCKSVGIRYEHLPELGIASEKRKHLATQEDYDALFDDYKRTWLPKQGVALSKIQAWLDSGEYVALTCFEHLPNQCHRHCVAEALGATTRHI